MKGHIAFCPHFHQPHFQLFKTREEAFRNSYLPWLNLLKNAVNIEGFYINLHLSGPLLYWLRDEKDSYLEEFKSLITSNKIGLIGGLADEPFVQLSSRSDDYLYQLKEYDDLLYGATGVRADNWQGIHIVERECGELVLKELSYAAKLINSPAIFYLDAETFYESHFNYPGSDYDYCLRHFGFVDPVAKTTIGHIPQKLLHYAFRDELAGQEFFSVPVHSQFRYQLLKRQSFTSADNVKIKPRHYYFYVKDALENAAKLAKAYGRKVEPILVMFEDAEKLGQWSKDPAGDVEWMLEFFELVAADDELEFTGLKKYLDKSGYLDTYPVSLSHSYPEWENWTAKRGIRGVTFGDERLRRVICRLRDFEQEQEEFEQEVLDSLDKKMSALDTDIRKIINRSILNSPERFELVRKLLKNEPQKLMIYEAVNRIRNLVYQEDPKWASRHPSYGSSPFYDVTGLAYLEMAYKVMQSIMNKKPSYPKVLEVDWDYDGLVELLIENEYQTIVIDTKGACISYHHVLTPEMATNIDRMTNTLVEDINLPAYNSIYRYAYPLIFTESDSAMSIKFYDEGGRKEVSRNAFRCDLLVNTPNGFQVIGDFATASYNLKGVETKLDQVKIELECTRKLSEQLSVTLTKIYIIREQSVSCEFALKKHGASDIELAISPQIVSSAAPSDEIEFRPTSFIGLDKGTDEIDINLKDISVIQEKGIDYKSIDIKSTYTGQVDYLYQIISANGDNFWNLISYKLSTDYEIANIQVKPAVREYYKDYVFESQSNLGYHTSGILFNPLIITSSGKANLTVETKWELDTKKRESDYFKVLNLIEKNSLGE